MILGPALQRENRTEQQSLWHIPEVDGLRAVAILLVYVYHVWEFGGSPAHIVHLFGRPLDLYSPAAFGNDGVDLFFVLSGFCLFLPLCRSATSLTRWDWREFYRRRILRIVPPYYAAIVYATLLPIALVGLFKVLHIAAHWQPIPSPIQYITHVLFLHTLSISTWNTLNGSFWSLGPEVQYYLVFPLLVFAFRRFGLLALAGMLAASIVYRVAVFELVGQSGGFNVRLFLFSIFSVGRWMEFALGMFAAYLVAMHRRAGRTFSAAIGNLCVLGSVLIYGLANLPGPSALSALPMRELLLALAFFLLLIAACSTRTPARRLLGSRIAVWIGLISYSVFLIHQPTAFYISDLLKKKLHVSQRVDFFILCTFGLLVILAGSYVFHLLFERPFLKMRARARQPAEAIAGAAVRV